jgi:type II secretory pathway component PulL
MAHIFRLRLGFGGASYSLTLRKEPRASTERLTRKQIRHVAFFLIVLIVVFVVSMYLGWWTLQQEEHELHQDHQHTSAEH